MRSVWMLWIAAACGRVGFDATADASAGDTDTASVTCTSPFMQTATGCYALVQTSVTWPQAKAACESLTSHLAVILDAGENTALAALLPVQRMWIGLSDLAIEMTFEWVTGEPFAYNAWANGEPNSATQDCVELIDIAQWNEFDCSMLRSYVCER